METLLQAADQQSVAAAAALLEHGVEKVYFLTICIGRGF